MGLLNRCREAYPPGTDYLAWATWNPAGEGEWRLRAGEIIKDIEKLAVHRDEVRHRGSDMAPVMLVVDTAPLATERMRAEALAASEDAARSLGVALLSRPSLS